MCGYVDGFTQMFCVRCRGCGRAVAGNLEISEPLAKEKHSDVKCPFCHKITSFSITPALRVCVHSESN